MRKTRKAAAVLTAFAMAAVSAVPAMADEIKDLYDYELQSREIETWNVLYSQLATDLQVLTNLYDGLLESDEYGKLVPAVAEAFMLDHALTIPSNFDIGWELTHINDYTKQNAMFGIQNLKYKNWETSTDAYTAEDYAGFQETWNAGSAE